jgi:hypothetical protein
MLKRAQAEEALAKAEKLKAEADQLDLEFLDAESGAKRKRDIEDAEFKSLNAAEKEQTKLQHQAQLEQQKLALKAAELAAKNNS